MIAKTLFSHLNDLNLIHDYSGDIREIFLDKQRPVKSYIGFDPTSDSLHVGSLLGFVTSVRWWILTHYNSKPHNHINHSVIYLIGGATGLIGDPSGKSTERNMLDIDTVNQNVKAVKAQLQNLVTNMDKNLCRLDEKLCSFGGGEMESSIPRLNQNVKFVNNIDWFENMNLMTFMRDVGKHFKVNNLLAKDSISSRLNSESELSFAEFSYNLFQAYDFAKLADLEGCNVQLGGSDQWGNILSGIMLSKKLFDKKVDGLTFPLMTKEDGKKFGKTETGTIWLDPNKTSPFKFYQFWINLTDGEAEKLVGQLCMFHIDPNLNFSALTAAITRAKNNPDQRILQNMLAQQMTTLVHGEQEFIKAKQTSQALFSTKQLTQEELHNLDLSMLENEIPKIELKESQLTPLTNQKLLVLTGLAKSNTDAKNIIKTNIGFVNNKQMMREQDLVHDYAFPINEKYYLVRKGKKTFCLVCIVD